MNWTEPKRAVRERLPVVIILLIMAFVALGVPPILVSITSRAMVYPTDKMVEELAKKQARVDFSLGHAHFYSSVALDMHGPSVKAAAGGMLVEWADDERPEGEVQNIRRAERRSMEILFLDSYNEKMEELIGNTQQGNTAK